MQPDLLRRKRTHFVLWRPENANPRPRLVIGTFGRPTLVNEQTFALAPVAGFTDLYSIAAANCALIDGTVYHYWFEVGDTNVYGGANGARVRCTDPTAYAVDWRARSPDDVPAGVVLFENGELKACDPGDPGDGSSADFSGDAPMASLPPNNRLVIYELPTAWTRAGQRVTSNFVGVGTFRDARRLVDGSGPGGNFAPPARHLLDLGVNALELLPPADTWTDRSAWGYGTSNYFAPDYDLGQVDSTDTSPPTACADFIALVRACHDNGIRVIYDAVMAFSNRDPYRNVNFGDFHVWWSHGDPEQADRDAFGGDLWKYAYSTSGYDPLGGAQTSDLFPARPHMTTHARHWMLQYHIDGLRLDSVTNVRNYGFLGQFRTDARQTWNDRWAEDGNPAGGGADARFIVIGESIPVHKNFLGRLDALWNEDFKMILRSVIVGENWSGEPSFEWSVRKLIDCRLLDAEDGFGFSDGTQAVNYVGSHDVEGERAERLYNYLDFRGVVLKEKQIKLAFACLLTAVGMPMIFAGDEFADEHDIKFWELPKDKRDVKQTDPVNYDRLADPWRRDVCDYVARLVRFRTQADALSVNEVDFIHRDFNDGKRVVVWKRGRTGIDDPVVVVANFSSWGTDTSVPGAHYDVPNWPATPPGRGWREISQGRNDPPEWVGREPLLAWEAKVYTPA